MCAFPEARVPFFPFEMPATSPNDARPNRPSHVSARHLGVLAVVCLMARGALPGMLHGQARVDTLRTSSSVALADSAFPVTGTASLVEMLAGKISALKVLRTSGAPNAVVMLQLRAQLDHLRDTPPLYVVDGIILSPMFPVSLNDIEAMDIESVQILKGASASSEYGFRGGAGVVLITTRRGKGGPLGKLQLRAQNEIGPDLSYGFADQAKSHAYRVNSSGQFVNASGVVVSRDRRVLQANGISENRYVVPTYNHSDQFFQRGIFNAQSVKLERNGATTNFSAGYSRNDQPGNVLNADGLERNTVRLNADYRWKNRLRFGVSSAYIRSNEEPALNSFSSFVVFDPDVDLLAPGSGIAPYVAIPDSGLQAVSPFFEQVFNDNRSRRSRSLLGLNASYRITSWLSVDASGGYDHTIRQQANVIPRGRQDAKGVPSPGLSARSADTITTSQARGGITLSKTFAKLTGRASFHADDFKEVARQRDAAVFDQVPSVSSSFMEFDLGGKTAAVGFDYAGRYAIDALGRRERRLDSPLLPRNYGRGSATWTVSKESWFPFQNVDVFRLRYGLGSAGIDTRAINDSPSNFSFSTFNPDYATEQEVGFDVRYKKRLDFSISYVVSRALVPEIVAAPPSLGGPRSVEVKQRMSGNTLEGTLHMRVLDNAKGLQWDVMLVGDRSRSRLVEHPRGCFANRLQRICAGELLNKFSGSRLVQNKSDLPAIHANSAQAFDINDEGFVVPVGAGNAWRDGKAKNLWGTTVSVDGRSLPWGLPIVHRTDVGQVSENIIGDGNADLSFGLQNSVRYKGLRIYAQLAGQLGGDIYNASKQNAYRRNTHPDVDQWGKPDEQRKPLAYYRALTGHYLQPFVESASHLRLAEASLGYAFTSGASSLVKRIGAERIEIDLVGRNLFTMTGYSGENVQGVSISSRYDDVVYPLTRTFTLATRVTF